MSTDYNNPAFKKLLQKLQEESWQLELLISGFAIFGLFSAFEPLEVLFKQSQAEDNFIITLILIIALISCLILTFNLLLHVILRGLWIGALGLRYVSGDIDYEYLNYSPRFTKYLKKKVGSFDRYIARLENYCSVIFAISFLLIFYILSFIFAIGVIGLTGKLLVGNDDIGQWGKYIGIPLLIFFSFGMLLVFIDFATLGWLKKKKWLSTFYFPFYWVFGLITLSFLYRPLVYNFLDNKFGRRLSFLLLPVYILLLVITSFNNKSSNYFNRDLNSSEIISNNSNYEDMLDEDRDFIKSVVIPSKVITKNYLKVFMVFDDDVDDNVFEFNPDLKPETDRRGLSSDMIILREMSRRERDSIRKKYMETLNQVYTVRIDSMDFESDFIVTQTKKNQKGIETYVNIKALQEGKHLLKVLRKSVKDKDTSASPITRIPFWYYPN